MSQRNPATTTELTDPEFSPETEFSGDPKSAEQAKEVMHQLSPG
jgi:hypothetical protein